MQINVLRERAGCITNTYTHTDTGTLPELLMITTDSNYPPRGLITGNISQNTAGTYDVVITISHVCEGKPPDDTTRIGRTIFEWVVNNDN